MDIRCESVDSQQRKHAVLHQRGRQITVDGDWVCGGPWERFGLYNSYLVVRQDGAALRVPAHAGELVPGATEDLIVALKNYDHATGHPPVPLTVELDPTYSCTSKDCGGRCFSREYRSRAPNARIKTEDLLKLVDEFAANGGRILRFDGGGDPLNHPAVRSGELVEFAYERGLKTTILTSGDLLRRSNLHRIARARCYLRVSLNAATEGTRQRFHGNSVEFSSIIRGIEEFSEFVRCENLNVPIGATFLLDSENFHEVVECASLCRRIGVAHFSVRRVLGPPDLRPRFTRRQHDAIRELLAEVREMHHHDFRVFVPWRNVDEKDIVPVEGDVPCERCWQSTFKVIAEPDPVSNGIRMQLCGRYRGNGIGQLLQLPPLIVQDGGEGWVHKWQRSFTDYSIPREELPTTCVSCIDRGFILMVDRILRFLVTPDQDFQILHLQSPQPQDVESWPPLTRS